MAYFRQAEAYDGFFLHVFRYLLIDTYRKTLTHDECKHTT